MEKVGFHDAEVVVGNVGEGGASGHVTERIDPLEIGLELGVHRDEAARVELDPRRAGGQSTGIGRSAGGDEKLRSFEDPRSVFGRNRN